MRYIYNVLCAFIWNKKKKFRISKSTCDPSGSAKVQSSVLNMEPVGYPETSVRFCVNAQRDVLQRWQFSHSVPCERKMLQNEVVCDVSTGEDIS